MRRISLLSALGLAAVSIAACKPDEVIPTEVIPTAAVRFINAVPDSGGAFGFDLRFIDIVENNHHYQQTFRGLPGTSSGAVASTVVQFKPARAGSRRFRIFLSDTIPAFASQIIKDTIVNLVAGSKYTAYLFGYMRTGSTPVAELRFVEENVPDPGASVALRVINATGAAIDVRHFLDAGAVPVPVTWGAVPAKGISTYVTVAPGLYRYNVQPAGGGATLFADALLLRGDTAATSAPPLGVKDLEALPGTRVAGSAVTMVIYPPSVVGARVPQGGAFAAAQGLSVWDRRPPFVVP